MQKQHLTPANPGIAKQMAELDARFGVTTFVEKRQLLVEKYGLKALLSVAFLLNHTGGVIVILPLYYAIRHIGGWHFLFNRFLIYYSDKLF
ncbi:MAG: hypothetical protein H7289_03900 [Mucilaginibacter sp.]|nr:hypothetical protein [Mucilaginibacter sp.]